MSNVYITAGLCYGDEGKGTTVDYLTRKYNASKIVRYNGGHQAGHNVVIDNNVSHCFSQFGSGTFVPNVETFLSHQMFIEPLSLLRESQVLSQNGIHNPMQRIRIDSRCHIVAPFHKLIGQMLEIARGENRYGSCGVGVGQAVLDSKRNPEYTLILKDAFNKKQLEGKISFLWTEKIDLAEQIIDENPDNIELQELFQKFKKDISISQIVNFLTDFASKYSQCIISDENYLYNLIESNQTIVFEGAHGSLIDCEYGFSPYITKTKTTFEPADNLLSHLFEKEKRIKNIDKIGIIRAYFNRHGPGPFITEDEYLTNTLIEQHNTTNRWQGKFRIGWFDLLSINYSIAINGKLDYITLTNLDRLSGIKTLKICKSYEYIGSQRKLLNDFFEWEFFNDNRIRITGFKKIDYKEHKETQRKDFFTKMLLDCRPLDYYELEGWQTDISGIKNFDNLPRQTKDYINFIQSKINIPISIISLGPKWNDKIMLCTGINNSVITA